MTFDQVQDVPGFEKLVANERVDVINFLNKNLNDVDLCLQIVDTETAKNVAYANNKLVAAGGWHVTQYLGQGKDGISFLGYRYSDENKKIRTVKLLSGYAKHFLNHTRLFSSIYQNLSNKSNNFFKLYITDNYTYYHYDTPLVEVTDKEFYTTLSFLCKMNCWTIKQTGFAFWDFGFGSGKNYMYDNRRVLRWIDYGGAGMVRCPEFDNVYKKYNNLPSLTTPVEYTGKESLIIADSNFLMCQFLLHIEYWKNTEPNNADIWSSMLQIRSSVAHEFVDLLPMVLLTPIAQEIYNNFKQHNWTDHITWKKVGKYIESNT